MKDRGDLAARHRLADLGHAAAHLELPLRGLLEPEQQRGHADGGGERKGLPHLARGRRVHLLVVRPFAVLRVGHEDGEETAGEAPLDHARQVQMAIAIAIEERRDGIAQLLRPQPEKHVVVAVEHGYQVYASCGESSVSARLTQ